MSEEREEFIKRMIEERDLSRTMAAHMWDARQQEQAATPSEDGGEVPEVVAHRPRPVLFSSDGELLMTVAQHSRIVAAKDAEIDALKGVRNQYWDDWNEAASNLIEMTRERDELRAQITDQPARQVGGDEREALKAMVVAFSNAGNRPLGKDGTKSQRAAVALADKVLRGEK